MAPQTREDVLPVRSDEAEKREAVLGTPRAHAPLDATANRHERRSRHPILDGTMSRDNAHASAQLGSRAVGGASGDGPDGAPVMPKLILNACCPSGQARCARIPPSAVCAFPFVSSKAFSFVMIPSVPMSITSLLSAIRAIFLNK